MKGSNFSGALPVRSSGNRIKDKIHRPAASVQAKRIIRMARFTNGWVKIHRKLLSPEWSQCLDVVAKGLLLELLLMANYKDTRAVRQSKVIIVKRGQILTSILELSNKLQVSRKIITSRLEILEQLGTITLKRDSLGTIITIENFSKYQDMESESGTTKAQPRNNEGNNEGTTKGTRIEEGKEVKEIKEGEEGFSPVDNFLDFYCNEMQKVYGKAPRITSHLRRVAGEILDEIGLDRSIALAGQFCASNRDYYVKRAHSLDVMLKDLAIIDMFV